MLIRRALIALGSMLLGGMSALAFQPPGGQGEFVPVTDLPAAEQAAGPAYTAPSVGGGKRNPLPLGEGDRKSVV